MTEASTRILQEKLRLIRIEEMNFKCYNSARHKRECARRIQIKINRILPELESYGQTQA